MPLVPADGACPLCGGPDSRSSWLGTTVHDGVTYEYRLCAACRSLHCEPMPDAATLHRMYGGEYRTAWSDPGQDVEEDLVSLVRVLNDAPPGIFVDFGCGTDGRAMAAAAALGWDARGVELVSDVASVAREQTGFDVRTVDDAAASWRGVADVLHVGDVAEHLTDPAAQLGEAIELVRPGGVVIARGPLEAHVNVFAWAVRAARRVRGRPRSSVPPYHVTLATVSGQRALFARVGLRELCFEVTEVSWPAPTRPTFRPRFLALFVLRRVSLAVSRRSGGRWGNRYLYIGRVG